MDADQKPQDDAVGMYCEGKDVEACRKAFDLQLKRVCAFCPE